MRDDRDRKRLTNHHRGMSVGEYPRSPEKEANDAIYRQYLEHKERLPGPFDPIHLQVATPKQAAAAGLLSLMFGISESFWCSGWTMGLEDRLWEFRENQPQAHSVLGKRLTERHRELLRLLSDECEGWWIYVEGQGPRFVQLADWKSGNVSYDPSDAG